MNNTLKGKTVNAIKHTLIFKSLGQISSVIATIFLVRALSENDYGVYNLLYSIIGFIGTIASLGIANTLQRYIPEYYQKKEFKVAHNLVRMISAVRLIVDTAMLGFILLFWQELAPVLKITEYKSFFLFFSLVILLYQQRSILEICLSSYFLHKYSKPIAVLFSVIKAAGYGMIILLGKNLWYVIFVDLSANFVVFILLQTVYSNKIPASSGSIKKLPRQEKKRISRYAFFYNFNDSGVGLLNADFDNFIIVMFLTPAAVGAYSFCVQLSIQITSILPLKYLKDVIKPAFFSIATSSKDKKTTTLLFQSLVKINSIFAIPCFFFLLLYSDDMISLFFNNKFIEYASVLTGIFFFSMLNSIPFGTMAQLKEKADIVLYSKIFAIYNLIADVILIKLFGIWGVVFATGTATMGKNGFIWYFVRQDASFKGMGSFFIKIILFWVMVSIIILSITSIIPSHALYQLVFGILIFTPAFLIQFRCNYFKDYEKKIITDLSNKKPALINTLKVLNILTDPPAQNS